MRVEIGATVYDVGEAETVAEYTDGDVSTALCRMPPGYWFLHQVQAAGGEAHLPMTNVAALLWCGRHGVGEDVLRRHFGVRSDADARMIAASW